MHYPLHFILHVTLHGILHLCVLCLGHKAQSTKHASRAAQIYTVWHYRKAALAPLLASSNQEAEEAAAKELALTEKALLKNIKSYQVP